MRLPANALALIVTGVAIAAAGVHDLRQPTLLPLVSFTPAVCSGVSAQVDVTNPASNRRHVSVGFNDLAPSLVEPGGSYGYVLDRGEVQVMVDGLPHGEPYRYQPPSCLLLP